MRRGVRIGLAGATTAVVIGAGAAIAVPGFAAGGGSTAATTTTVATTTGATTQTAPTQADRDARREAYRAALAKELGIDVATLEKAEEKARATVFVDNLDEMVSSGRLTKEQAETLRAAAANGTLDEALKAQARARLKAALDGQVTAGLLTRAQADAMLTRFDENEDARIPGMGFGGGRGGHHGGPGMFGGGPGIP